ncbi:MAG TPA: glutamate--tRNA ligase family protein [Candidatus Limnocylindrales bacterium]|nr:glutamate--tRNA ligase family protein [Candidatus Limnocylindrales bacterium]
MAALAAGGATRTRFAPAPTGFLHLGHVASALWVWGAARLAGAEVLIRIEDHDRQRSRAAFADALVEDLAWLGFVPDTGPVRQTDPDATAAYEAALEQLTAAGLVYRCACTRTTFGAWAREHGRTWSGVGCPAACRTRTLPGDAATSLRVTIGAGMERFDDLLHGPQVGDPAATGDLVVRDREANWTYGFAVVVDDLRQGIDLVVRGEDLLPETARQIRLAAFLDRPVPPRFLHHPLIRSASGAKLSKTDGDSGVRDLRATGRSAREVRELAAQLAGVPAEVAGAAVAPGS